MVGSRVLLDGPPVRLMPSAAQGVGMALHELSTNAAKYGALSNASGRVTIAWNYDRAADRIAIDWIESDGPPVVAPERKGFGHTVIGAMAEASVNGQAAIVFAAEGVTWRLMAPVEGNVELPGK